MTTRPFSTESKAVSVHYYALLREERGLSSEEVQTEARTPRELYAGLQETHGFSLPPERLSLAVNNVFAQWDQDLKAQDAVVFLPPVAGG